jgi:hypothetical protein
VDPGEAGLAQAGFEDDRRPALAGAMEVEAVAADVDKGARRWVAAGVEGGCAGLEEEAEDGHEDEEGG